MTYSNFHWKVLNFLVRRVVAIGFVTAGLVLVIYGLPNVLPGGTVLLNGVPTDDLVFRWVSILLPSLFIVFGIFLFKAAPFEPSKNMA